MSFFLFLFCLSFDKCSLMKSVWFPLYLKGMGCCLCVSASRMATLPYSSFQQDKKALTQYVTFVTPLVASSFSICSSLLKMLGMLDMMMD